MSIKHLVHKSIDEASFLPSYVHYLINEKVWEREKTSQKQEHN